MKKLTFIFCALIIAMPLFSQSDTNKNKGFFGAIDFHKTYSFRYSSTLASKTDFSNLIRANGLKSTIGYFLNPHLSTGISFGLENFDAEGNTAPLIVDVRGYLRNSRNTPFVYLNGGRLLKLSNTFEKGSLFEFGMGYKFFISKKLCFNTTLGYNLRRFPESNALVNIYDDNWNLVSSDLVTNPASYHSFAFSFGVFF